MSKISVLIADDNERMNKHLEEIINAEPDMEVVAVVADGNDACKKIGECKPDVVLLDIVMPGLDSELTSLTISLICITSSTEMIIGYIIERLPLTEARSNARSCDLNISFFVRHIRIAR